MFDKIQRGAPRKLALFLSLVMVFSLFSPFNLRVGADYLDANDITYVIEFGGMDAVTPLTTTPAAVTTVTFFNTITELNLVVSNTPNFHAMSTIQLDLAPFSGFNVLAPVRLYWVQDGITRRHFTSTNLQAMGINPEDVLPEELSSGVWQPSSWFSVISGVTSEHVGAHRLHVYVADQLIGQSEPVQINVTEFTGSLDDVVVTFVYADPSRVMTVHIGDHPDSSPIHGFYITIPPNIGITGEVRLELQWIRPDIGASATWTDFHIDVNGHMNYRFYWSPILGNWPITDADAGYSALFVYLADSRVGESEPIRVEVLPPRVVDLSGVNVTFTTRLDSLHVAMNALIYDFRPVRVDIDLGSVNTGLHGDSAVSRVWRRDGATFDQYTRPTNIQRLGIDPNNPGQLTGPSEYDWQWSERHLKEVFGESWGQGIAATEQVHGIWRMHIYIAGQHMGYSDPIEIQVGNLPPVVVLDAPVITLDANGYTLSWDRVITGSGVNYLYHVLVDGVVHSGIGADQYSFNETRMTIDLRTTLMLPPGTYQIQVQAIAGNVASLLSNAVAFTQDSRVQLPTPSNLRVIGTHLVWDAVPNASSYGVESDAAMWHPMVASTNSFDLSILEAFSHGIHPLRVMAFADWIDFTDSDFSAPFLVTIPLTIPTGGVTFTYPSGNFGFPATASPQQGSTHNMGIEFAPRAGVAPGNIVFQWLRNGQPVGAPIQRAEVTGPNNLVRLTLSNVNANAHAGEWQLRATTYMEGIPAFVDYSRVSVVSVRAGNVIVTPDPSPEPTPAPAPTPDPTPLPTPAPTPAPPEVPHQVENHADIYEQLFRTDDVVMVLPEGVDEIRLFGRTMDMLMEAEADLTVVRNDGTAITIPITLLEEIREAGQGVLGSGGGNFHINLARIDTAMEGPVLAGLALDVRVNGARIANLVEDLHVVAAQRSDELTDEAWDAFAYALELADNFTDDQWAYLADIIGNPSIERLRELVTDPDILTFLEALPYAQLVALAEALRGEYLTHFETAVTLAVYLGGAVAGLNHYRFVAFDADGNRLPGQFDPATALFSFATYTTGNFLVEYDAHLRRLVLDTRTFGFADLAQQTWQAMDVLPVAQDGRILLPLRFVAEALGADVNWQRTPGDAPNIVNVTFGGETAQLFVGELTPHMRALGLDDVLYFVNERALVPMEFFAVFFGATIAWDSITEQIEIIF